jgi:hypothetical protein
LEGAKKRPDEEQGSDHTKELKSTIAALKAEN